MGTPGTARARARAEITAAVKEAARAQLAQVGAPALSVRAVARELGMASSAVYRYFASRDELLTALIVDAYDAVGAAAEDGARAGGDDPGGRWLAACRAVRIWAVDHPHEFSLLYGSPVPGYRAPADTIGPAARVPLVLAAAVADAARLGLLHPPTGALGLGSGPRLVTPEVLEAVGIPAGDDRLVERALGMWVALIGTISFELFGHFENVVSDRAGYFELAMAGAAGAVGLEIPVP